MLLIIVSLKLLGLWWYKDLYCTFYLFFKYFCQIWTKKCEKRINTDICVSDWTHFKICRSERESNVIYLSALSPTDTTTSVVLWCWFFYCKKLRKNSQWICKVSFETKTELILGYLEAKRRKIDGDKERKIARNNFGPGMAG